MKQVVQYFTILGLFLFLPTSAYAVGAKLRWVDTSNNEENFKIERSIGGNTLNFIPVGVVPANTVTSTDNGLVENQEYCYRVCACNAGGCSLPTASVCIKSLLSVPSSPTNLTVTPE